jgi:hypothetical protein
MDFIALQGGNRWKCDQIFINLGFTKFKLLFKTKKMEQALVRAYFLNPHLALSVLPSCNDLPLSEGSRSRRLIGQTHDEITT